MATVDQIQTDLLSQYGKGSTAVTSKAALDKDAFLNLLVTELQYQDPLNPTNDKEFLAQMAQFTSLEQMNNVSATLQKNQAYTLIGKTIKATVTNPISLEVTDVTGKVEGVITKNGATYVLAKNTEIPLEKITSVQDTVATASIADLLKELTTIKTELASLKAQIAASMATSDSE